MAEFKKLSAVEAVEAVSETANVLIEENGVIKRAAKSEIGAQADWAEMDENSPAFIKNKPEYDLDMNVRLARVDVDNNWHFEYDVHYVNSFENILAKLENGICPRCKVVFDSLSCVVESDDYVSPIISVGCHEYGCDYWQSYGEICFGTYSWDKCGLFVCINDKNELFFNPRFNS
jgi:hypothetical protein